MEFTPYSALQTHANRICQNAIELYEGDVPLLEQAQATRLGKLEVNGSDYEGDDVTSRAAELGATHMVKVAQQRQLVQSGGMMVGTGGPGFGTGMYVPTTREEVWQAYVLYRAEPERMPEQLRCGLPH